eukprot:Hpha_TRINITY_DN33635_c0_g1::TRINITY_DN33635_c0_g1_i2::g.43148::m.43148
MATQGDNGDRKLYVANLPPGFSKQDLESAFAAYGVEDVVMHNRCNREDGRLSGFVILTGAAGAQYAVDSMQGWSPDGQMQAVVRLAQSGGSVGGGVKRAWGEGVQAPGYAAPTGYTAAPTGYTAAPAGYAAAPPGYAVGDVSQRRVYCANLPPNVDDSYVRSVFSSFGEVQEVVLLPQKTSSLKRAVVVVMADNMSAQSAISHLQGWCPTEGSPETVVVRQAGPPSSGAGAGASPPPPHPGAGMVVPAVQQHVAVQQPPAPPAVQDPEAGTKVYVSGLPPDSTEEWVRSYFSEVCGAVRDVKVLRNASVNSGRLSGFVGFLHHASVQAALSLNGALLPDGAVLHVRPPIPRGGQGQAGAPAVRQTVHPQQSPAAYPTQPPGVPPGYHHQAYQHNPYAYYQQAGGWPSQPPGVTQGQAVDTQAPPTAPAAPAQVQMAATDSAPPPKRKKAAETIKGTARTPIKLEVSNIDPTWDESNVSALFAQFGEVIETEVEAGMGLGTVWLRGAPAATLAVSHLDGSPCGNSPLPLSVRAPQ